VELLDEAIENKDRDMEEIEEEWDENRLIDKYHHAKELDEPIEIEGDEELKDPNILIAEAYDATMLEMKEDLLIALTERKKKVLPIALQIFNKVQDKNFTT
jgi:hypothetical protein